MVLLAHGSIVLLSCLLIAAERIDERIRERPVPFYPEDGGVIDLPMLRDPVLHDPQRNVEFNPGLKPLWIAALARPEYDLRLASIEAFVKARDRGLDGLEDIPALLLDRLENDDVYAVRLAAARALVEFDHQTAAPALLSASEGSRNVGLDLILISDRVLAKWDHEPARAVWLRRVADAANSPTRAESAIIGFGQVRDPQAREPLVQLALNRNAARAVRLASGRALGRIMTAGLLDSATQLADGDELDRLISASMLWSHGDAESVQLLQQLAGDENPTVAATALQSLNHIDPALIVPRATELFGNNDFNVRLEVARAVATDRTVESVALLTERLNDRSVLVRSLARTTLIDFDTDAALTAAVREHLKRALAGDDPATQWRSLEQAALIAGVLDAEPDAERLITLLDFDREEVRLASAAALRQLAIPETLDALHKHCRKLTDIINEAKKQEDYVPMVVHGREATQLFMLMGELRYKPADALLREYIPKHSFAPMTRAGAIYALGKIYEDNLQSDLANQFVGRLSDVNPMDPEFPTVRRFSALGLARMKTDNMDSLEHFLDVGNATADIQGACRWAIMHITGKQLPPLAPLVSKQTGWFLEPID